MAVRETITHGRKQEGPMRSFVQMQAQGTKRAQQNKAQLKHQHEIFCKTSGLLVLKPCISQITGHCLDKT
jgi:hypothetical protein